MVNSGVAAAKRKAEKDEEKRRQKAMQNGGDGEDMPQHEWNPDDEWGAEECDEQAENESPEPAAKRARC